MKNRLKKKRRKEQRKIIGKALSSALAGELCPVMLLGFISSNDYFGTIKVMKVRGKLKIGQIVQLGKHNKAERYPGNIK